MLCYRGNLASFPPNVMNIQHFEKGFHYNDKELLVVARKIGKLATYCKKIKDDASVIRIDSENRKTEKKRDSMKVSVTVTLPKKVLRAESRKPDAIEGLDRCCEKLTGQLKKYKELHQAKGMMQLLRKRKK